MSDAEIEALLLAAAGCTMNEADTPADSDVAVAAASARSSRSRTRRRGSRRSSRRAREPIAIIGIGCRVPGGGDDSPSVLAAAARRRRRDRPVPRRPLGRRRASTIPTRDARAHRHARGGFLERVDRLRPAVLRHLAARGAGHGPAAAPAARGDLGGARARRPGARSARASRTGVFVGICSSDYAYLQLKSGDTCAARRALHLGHRAQRGLGPPVLPARACRGRASRSTPRARRRWSRCTWPARRCAAASAAWRSPAA